MTRATHGAQKGVSFAAAVSLRLSNVLFMDQALLLQGFFASQKQLFLWLFHKTAEEADNPSLLLTRSSVY